TQLINVANKDIKEIALTNKYTENNEPKNFYYYSSQYYNAKDENEVFNKLINTEENKKILLDKNYKLFGASFKNKYWALNFGSLYAKDKININSLLKYTNEERAKIGIKKLELNDEEEAVKDWITSPEHKRQIINSDYIYFGAGFTKDIWVLNFGRLYVKDQIDINLLFKLTNNERTKNGAKKLELNNQLVEAAQKYAEYLANKKIYDHIPNALKKIPGITWAENLGHEFEKEEEAIKRWMKST
ncbi:6293_t:CDS:2, partial [Cetraspora pellucida]